MPILTVQDAEIFFETFGTGPLLLFIAGAHGRGEVFRQTAALLAQNYTVVCYDRRGYSKSLFRGSQDLANRLSTDALDAHLLIKHLSSEPALVFGSSSGAIVAQNLLITYPECVKTVVVHEPPLISILPDPFQSRATRRIQDVYDTYRARGPSTVLLHSMDTTRSDDIRANLLFFFEFEIRQYTSSHLDITSLAAHRDKFVPAAGIESGNRNGIIPVTIIATELRKDLVRLPGGHLPFMTVPEEFSAALNDLLTKN